MGYRKLLKDYIAHVRDVTGSDLIELAYYAQVLSKRDIGELRAIAAELRRESHEYEENQNYDHLVRELVERGALDLAALDDLPRLTSIEPHDMSQTQFAELLSKLARDDIHTPHSAGTPIND